MKVLVVLFVFLLSLYSFELKSNSVESSKWKSGQTLLTFLENHNLPLKLYYDLSGEDQKVMTDIREGVTYYVVKDCSQKIYQAVIPLNEELEVHIFRDIDSKYKIEIIPIDYTAKKIEKVINLGNMFSKDILKATHNYPLTLKLERIFKGAVKFNSIKKGDKLGVIYIDKSWMGKKFGSQKVLATYYEHNKKRVYRVLYKGRYYDKNVKLATKKVSSFIVPCRYRRISDRFTRKRWHPILKRYRPHNGIDYANRRGTPIHATYSGKVRYAGWVRGYGKYVEIIHPNGYKSVYGHLSRIKVKKGQRVKKGQTIGLMGSTGLSTGSHLHFGISKNGRWINPAYKIVIVKKKNSKLKRTIQSYVNRYVKALKYIK